MVILETYFNIEGTRYDVLKGDDECVYSVVDTDLGFTLFTGCYKDCKRFALALVKAFNELYYS